MSYDLQIYAARALSIEEMQSLLTHTGLVIEDPNPSTTSLTFVRGAKRNYCFTLGLPIAIDAEDVPDEVTASTLDATHYYHLLVEGSASSEVPHAIKFARRLAKAASGIVLDQQTGQIWSQGKLREAPRVEVGLVSVVKLTWYVLANADSGTATDVWLTLVRRHLPEALPRKYGTYEPLQHRFADGDRDFVDFVRTADGTVYFSANKPIVAGSLDAGPTYGGTVQSHSLTVLAAPLDDERWRTALMRLFIDFAEQVNAVAATAEVLRGLTWSGRSLGYESNSERATYLAPRGCWLGLPPYPVWWSWFGPDYAPLVRDHLPPDTTDSRGHALFHWRSDTPADREQLIAALPPANRRPRRWPFQPRAGRPSTSWLPTDLLPIEGDSEPQMYLPLLTPAPVRPASLT